MTDSRDTTENPKNNGDNVDMDPRYENLAAYVLDALDQDDERESVEILIENDPEVAAEYRELAEVADHLAIGVPPVAPSVQLKSRIMELASRDSAPTQFTPQPVARTVPWWKRAFRSGVATSAVAAVLVLVVAGVLTAQNSQLSNEVSILRSELTSESTAVAIIKSELSTTLNDSETKVASMKTEMDQMEDEFGATTKMVVHQEEMMSELATANMALRQTLRDQSWLTYVTMREDYQLTSWLANSEASTPETSASGLIAVSVVDPTAVLQVQGLEQPQPGFAYTLWLMGNGAPRPVLQFEVSEIGSANVVFQLPAPLFEYTSVIITQERLNAIGRNPSGTMVISAETN